ncbi:type VII toxin-antitoxin system MntA family adenylyltransferase antitoxin [Marinospirillum alkaliphilum]|uniref:Nucleotidyltransferase domain-containing protein n=1 Tax=Marinospirillum alkaliphilum DSM 21637 TaxID=1122209 RepID=A0A1K1U8R0_9GAMM|nr:nucleotidyltransferase domain-containing protein [Marinospirillum alkaliphilum]SFX09194.1 Nucleotidyltransferase domain-containing protein [Marinospirillum alkaliphilum DSM 21637]
MSDMDSDQWIKQDKTLSALRHLAENAPVDVLWLYGSRTKGTADESSDYDLAVAFTDFETDPLERRLRPELLSQQWCDALGLDGDRLSLVDINQAPLPLAMAVIRDGKAVFVRNPLRLIREELRISSMWEVDYQYHRAHYG